MAEPKTFVERLDAARTGAEFNEVLVDLFNSLDRARQDDEEKPA